MSASIEHTPERNYTRLAGEAFTRTYRRKAAGVAVNVTGWGFRMRAWRDTPNGVEELFDVTEAAGITVNGAAGEIVIFVAADLMRAGEWRYLLTAFPGGVAANARHWLRGKLIVRDA